MEAEVVNGFPDIKGIKEPKKKAPRWILIMVVIWCCSMMYAFWYFLLMDTRLFYGAEQERLVEFEKSTLAKELERYLIIQGHINSEKSQTRKGYIFHFFNGQCSCDKANQAHVKKLIKHYSQLGFMFLLVPKQEIKTDVSTVELAKPWQYALQEWPNSVVMLAQHELNNLPIPASPSAAVLNSQGKLSYFGPYALGGICKADENGLIETVLNGMVAGMEPDHPFVGGFGCFCQWQD